MFVDFYATEMAAAEQQRRRETYAENERRLALLGSGASPLEALRASVSRIGLAIRRIGRQPALQMRRGHWRSDECRAAVAGAATGMNKGGPR